MCVFFSGHTPFASPVNSHYESIQPMTVKCMSPATGTTSHVARVAFALRRPPRLHRISTQRNIRRVKITVNNRVGDRELALALRSGNDRLAARLVVTGDAKLPSTPRTRRDIILSTVLNRCMTRSVSELLLAGQITPDDITPELFQAAIHSPHVFLLQWILEHMKPPLSDETQIAMRFWSLRHLVRVDRDMATVCRELRGVDLHAVPDELLCEQLMSGDCFSEFGVKAAADLVRQLHVDSALADSYKQVRQISYVVDMFEAQASSGNVDYNLFAHAIELATTEPASRERVLDLTKLIAAKCA